MQAVRLVPTVLHDVFFPFADRAFHVTPKGRQARAGAIEPWMGVAVAIGVFATIVALVLGPVGRYGDEYVLVSMFWGTLNLFRLLGMLAVLWGKPVPPADPKIQVSSREAYGFRIRSHTGERVPLVGWSIGEDRLRAPGDTPVPRGWLVRGTAEGREVVLAGVEAGGALRFPNDGARAHLLSLLVGLKLDQETPYRPAGAAGRVMARMLGLSRSA